MMYNDLEVGVIMKKYKVGQIIKCRVTGIEKYGIFVSVDKHYNGLIHISEVSSEFVRNINDYVKIDDSIFAKILSVENGDGKMKLSIKDIDYKNTGKNKVSLESSNGFIPLKNALAGWMESKLVDIDKKTSSK